MHVCLDIKLTSLVQGVFAVHSLTAVPLLFVHLFYPVRLQPGSLQARARHAEDYLANKQFPVDLC